mgnify:CR=1 FL=1
MTEFLLILFDLIGTVAFAISGALVGVGKKMDLFGTIVLAVSTACGGGVIRDMVVGNIPPNMFRNPLYVSIAAVVAVIVFFLCYWHRKMPKWAGPLYDRMLFWFDTLGLAAFTVDGIMVGIMAGYNPKLVPLAAFFYAYVKEGAAILARATDIPVELVSIIQAIIIMLVVAERFLYKQKHRMMVKAAEKELEFRNQQAAKEAE